MPNGPEGYKDEIDFIQSSIGKYFPTYKTEVEFDVVSVYIRVYSGEDIEDQFDDLRKELVPKNYIPYLHEENGEYIISVKKSPEKNYRSVKTNIIMLGITIITTLIAGTFWWHSYRPVGGFFSLHNILRGGLYFSLPLMTILGIHELSHYFTAKKHSIYASLPFFIPAPPPLGTLGAVISIREPIPDKKSLLDVGVAGPLGGLFIAIPVSIIGLYLGGVQPPTAPISAEGMLFNFRFPLLLRAISFLVPFGEVEYFHPTLFAGWLGFLVTGLNLLPAGQLDGGHVLRALLKDNAKYASYAAVIFLIIVGLWQYIAWLIFALFILFLVGVKHPPPLNDFSKLDNKRKIVGLAAVLILFLSFHPLPIEEVSYRFDYEIDLEEAKIQNISLDENALYTFNVKNTGRSDEDLYDISDEYHIDFTSSSRGWNITMYALRNENWEEVGQEFSTDTFQRGDNITMRLLVEPYHDNVTTTDIEVRVDSNTTNLRRTIDLTTNIRFDFETEITSDDLIYQNIFLMREEEDKYNFKTNVTNKGRIDSYEISTVSISNESWSIYYQDRQESINFTLEPRNSKTIDMVLTRDSQINNDIEIYSSQDVGVSEDVVVNFEISIRSEGTGIIENFEFIGVKI